MKTIIKSVFLVAILALVITGCQKEGDDLNVSLKSTIAFTGGVYISGWQSGDAEFECSQAGGCDGGSYKIDHGVYAGAYFNEGDVTVTGISKQEFSWTSIYPVCKIIVKAGNGAYIFDIGGAQSGSVPYPKDLGVKEKDISHITFCFGKPETPPELVLALKTFLADGALVSWAVTNGEGSEINSMYMGYINYVYNGNNSYELYDHGLITNPIGTIEISDYTDLLDGIHYLEIVMNITSPNMSFLSTYLYAGSVDGYKSYLSYWDGTSFADYYSFPFVQSETSTTRTFKIPFDEISE